MIIGNLVSAKIIIYSTLTIVKIVSMYLCTRVRTSLRCHKWLGEHAHHLPNWRRPCSKKALLCKSPSGVHLSHPSSPQGMLLPWAPLHIGCLSYMWLLYYFLKKCVFSNTCTFLEHLRSQTLAKCSHRINAPPLQPVDALSAQLALLLCSIPCDSEGSSVPLVSQSEGMTLFFVPQEEWLPKWASEKTMPSLVTLQLFPE